MLFLSNLIALVLAGTLVFTVIGAGEQVDVTGPNRRRVRPDLASLGSLPGDGHHRDLFRVDEM